MLQKLTLAALLLLTFSLTYADAPLMINYQGRLTDSLGVPLSDTTLDITFSIYRSDGIQVWTSGPQPVSIDDGIFNYVLGSNVELPSAIISSQYSRFLGIKVGDDDEIVPRTELVSVPYAYKVGTIHGATGGGITGSLDLTEDIYSHDDAFEIFYPSNILFQSDYDQSAEFMIGEMFSFDSEQGFLRLGTAAEGYSFPSADGTADQIMSTDGNGHVRWIDVSAGSSFWNLSTRVLYTNDYYGLSRGGVGNALLGDSAQTHVNFGVACTTGVSGYNTVYLTVSGGYGNKADSNFATVSGGSDNHASNHFATVGGGQGNIASGTGAMVAGISNDASGDLSFIGGGHANHASGTASSISGGTENWAIGSHSTVGGGFLNYANNDWSTVGGGSDNVAMGERSTVSGGFENEAHYGYSTIGGGYDNTTFDDYATIGGGRENYVEGAGGVIAGGLNNFAYGDASTVSGGYGNNAGGDSSSIGGGRGNLALGSHSTIGGGSGNQASNTYCTVGGGENNIASGTWATVAGNSNQASGDLSFVGGGYANQAGGTVSSISGGYENHAISTYSTVGGGWDNRASETSSTVGGGESNSAQGEKSTVGGGYSNTASGAHATIGGGYDNMTLNEYATIGGGKENYVERLGGVVAGGLNNSAIGAASTVGGGYSNIAGGDSSSIGGGRGNITVGSYSTIGGGSSNFASGSYATIPGGYLCTAAGKRSLAIGNIAKANHDGSVVMVANSSSTASDSVRSGGAEQMVLRADGGIYLTNTAELAPYDATRIITTRGGAYLSGNGTTWTNSSDRNKKENFRSVNGEKILQLLQQLEITQWNYRTEDESVKHIGPVAQDFHALFGVGGDDKSISTVDPAGIALAAIKELDLKTKDLDRKTQELAQTAARVEELERELGEMRQLLNKLIATSQ